MLQLHGAKRWEVYDAPGFWRPAEASHAVGRPGQPAAAAARGRLLYNDSLARCRGSSVPSGRS